MYIFKLWLSILYSLQLVKPIENKMTVVQGKLKSMPIICIYVLLRLPLAECIIVFF